MEEVGSGRQVVEGFGQSVGNGIDRGTDDALSCFTPNTHLREEEAEVAPLSRGSMRSPQELQLDHRGQDMMQGGSRGEQGFKTQARKLNLEARPTLAVHPFYSPRTATQPMTAQLKSSATSGAASPFQAGRDGRRIDDCPAPAVPINSRTDFTIQVKSRTATARAVLAKKSQRTIK